MEKICGVENVIGAPASSCCKYGDECRLGEVELPKILRIGQRDKGVESKTKNRQHTANFFKRMRFAATFGCLKLLHNVKVLFTFINKYYKKR